MWEILRLIPLVSTILPIYFDYLADLAKISAADYLAIGDMLRQWLHLWLR